MSKEVPHYISDIMLAKRRLRLLKIKFMSMLDEDGK